LAAREVLPSGYVSFGLGANSSVLVPGGTRSFARWPASFSLGDVEVTLGDTEHVRGFIYVLLQYSR